jgi:hypothetical protein
VKLGFTKIIMIKVDNIEYKCPEKYKQYVEIHNKNNEGNKLLPKYDTIVKRSGYDWCLSIDVDEFLMLHKRYKTIDDFVKEKMKNHKTVNIFYFRWGMIEKYDIEQNVSFKDILNNYKIFINKHIKFMVRIQSLHSISKPHACMLKNIPNIYFENRLIVKKDFQLFPLAQNSYSESMLIHIHTRSLNNIMIKTFKTVLTSKIVRHKYQLVNTIGTYDNEVDIPNDVILTVFKKLIGLKAILPFNHKRNGIANINMQLFDIKEYDNQVINNKMERNMLSIVLEQNGINEKKYDKYIKRINDIVINAKFFTK